MRIWHDQPTLALLVERSKQTMVDYLGIQFIEIGDDFLTAKMAVDHRTHQAKKIMHGGASCVLAETVGSTAANLCVDSAQYYCVGLDINTNHIRSISSGFVLGTTKPFHIGKSTQVWGIQITDDEGRLISVTRLTMAVLSIRNTI